jgi:hypothetical protein
MFVDRRAELFDAETWYAKDRAHNPSSQNGKLFEYKFTRRTDFRKTFRRVSAFRISERRFSKSLKSLPLNELEFLLKI